MSDFYGNPAFYDTLFNNEKHIGFYRDLCAGCAGNVLELACGTGQIIGNMPSVPNAKFGTDLSPAMVGEAVKNYGADGVSFAVEDMRSFTHDRQYDVVFVARNSFLHLHTGDDFEKALGCVAACLAPGGVFAFDIFIPSLPLLAKGPEPSLMFARAAHPELGTVDVFAASSYDRVSQIVHSDWWLLDADGARHEAGTLDLRCIFPQELPLILKANGFEIVHRYGSLKKDAFDEKSGAQVCVCRRMIPQRSR